MAAEKQKTVLIVEDERAIREVLADALSQEGLRVVQAKNGQEGLVQAQGETPDIILLDLLMPKKGGKAMLEDLENNEKTGGIPIILLTNLNELEEIAEMTAHKQVTDYIVKSDWHIKDVVQRVTDRLNKTI